MKFLYKNPDGDFWKTYEQKRKSFYELLCNPLKALGDLKNASKLKMELEKDKSGNILIPFSAVIAVGDFMVISEEDII